MVSEPDETEAAVNEHYRRDVWPMAPDHVERYRDSGDHWRWETFYVCANGMTESLRGGSTWWRFTARHEANKVIRRHRRSLNRQQKLESVVISR